MSDDAVPVIALSETQQRDLYVLLKSHEGRMSESLERLRDSLEILLYQRYSIAEMEAIVASIEADNPSDA
jgi:hypothetical protein